MIARVVVLMLTTFISTCVGGELVAVHPGDQAEVCMSMVSKNISINDCSPDHPWFDGYFWRADDVCLVNGAGHQSRWIEPKRQFFRRLSVSSSSIRPAVANLVSNGGCRSEVLGFDSKFYRLKSAVSFGNEYFLDANVSSELPLCGLISPFDQSLGCIPQSSGCEVQANSCSGQNKGESRNRIVNKLLYPAFFFLGLNVVFFTYWLGTIIVPDPQMNDENKQNDDDKTYDDPDLDPALLRNRSSVSREVSQGKYFSG